MLCLKNITKDYETEEVVHALRGVSINFRKNEFVAILGPSGCGKTTLLNIIGGLDHYTDGDLVIGGTSTKEYEDRDWDAYRNHRVGFVFQSYNLIPHQTVLSNVELALTLSGVSRQERHARAAAALESVGLGDQLKKKPNQMSGGQMQRVAIARALVNNPDIVLADEPTGALDTQTSVQIMEILKEISQDKLIVMVTHNPDLAEQYASRIIRVVDGLVVDDSNPYDGEELVAEIPLQEESTGAVGTVVPEGASIAPVQEPTAKPKKRSKQPKTSMSFFTALSLSLNNLMTKKARTFLTSFAGSIGIIGIALVLALSNGIQLFIDKVQEDTLSSYPLSIESSTMDLNSLMSTFAGTAETDREVEDGYIYSNSQLQSMVDAIKNGYKENDLKAFREYIESGDSKIKENAVVQYRYGVTPQIYINRDGTYMAVSPSDIFGSLMGAMGAESSMGVTVWDEMIDNQELLESQYELLEGKWPTAYNEVVLVTDKNHGISDLMLYALGIKDPKEFEALFTGATVEGAKEETKYTYEELLDVSFRMVLSADYYRKKADDTYEDIRRDTGALDALLANSSEEIKIVGILAANPDATATSISGVIGYSHLLTDYIIDKTLEKDANGNYRYQVVKDQLDNPEKDIFTNKKFYEKDTSTDEEKAEKFKAWLAEATESEKATQYDENLSSMVFTQLFMQQYMGLSATYPPKDLTGTDLKPTHEPAIREAIEACLASDPNLLNRLKQNYPEMVPNSMTAEGLSDALKGQTYDTLIMVLATLKVYENSGFDIAYGVAQEQALQMTPAEKATKYETYAAQMEQTGGAAGVAELWDTYLKTGTSSSSYKANLRRLGVADSETPSAIYIYPKSFDGKELISQEIEDYNKDHKNGEITYTDYIGIMLSSISIILDVITYVLVAFVSISLVVSSIMIGIITYISVLERIKEIGILRAIGASKRDVSRVFLAETLIVGFAAGILGILVTLILSLPINFIIRTLSGFNNIGAKLPFVGAVVLVLISMALTLVAGLIPAKIAAKKEPVEALRSE